MFVWVLGGTTEGRLAAEKLTSSDVNMLTTVISDYGAQLLNKVQGAEVRIGALTYDAMLELIGEGAVCAVDATHPYAREVKELAEKACRLKGIPYIRVSRNILARECGVDEKKVVHVSSFREAADFLEKTSGNVLLAIGSKNLQWFAGITDYHERVYARVLSDSESVRKCEESGLSPDNIIALKGPFSHDMNVALLRQTKASYMVTKQSGGPGGFFEKASATAECGVTLIVVSLDEDALQREMAGIKLDDAVAEAKKIYFETLNGVDEVGGSAASIDSTGADSASIDSTGADSAGINMAGIDSTSIDSTGISSASVDSAGISSASIDSTGADSASIDSTCISSASVDSAGINLAGIDSTGADSAGADPTGIDSTSADSTDIDVGGAYSVNKISCDADNACEDTGRFPIFIDLRGKMALIVGGGHVAARRAKVLIGFGAKVRIVAPSICDDLPDGVEWINRRWQPRDVDGASLVVAASNDPDVNRQVAEEAITDGIPVSCAGDRDIGSFHFPAIVKTEGVVCGLTSGDPLRTKKIAKSLRDFLIQ